MSLTLAALGCAVAMLSECALHRLHLHTYLKLKAPGALIANDNRDKPWIQWAAAELKALILVAGVSCLPFSVAGKMLGGSDPRAWDALLVNANCPVPDMNHRVYVAAKLSPQKPCFSQTVKQGVTLVMGLEGWDPEALGTVWDITGSKSVPVDFNVPLVRDFNLDSWLSHFSDITDQQLVSHNYEAWRLQHGLQWVCSGVQLDHLTMLA